MDNAKQITAAEAFDQQGYVVVRQFFDATEIDALAHMVDRIHAQWRQTHGSEQGFARLVNMHSLTRADYFVTDPAARVRFFAQIASTKFTALIDGMFGDGIYFHNTQLFFNPADNTMQPYWHRDLQFSDVPDAVQAQAQPMLLSLHARIPLVPERGVALVPGTHHRWDTDLESKIRFGRNGQCHHESLPGEVLLDLNPGDLLVFDAQMIHRGNYESNPERKALDICLGKPHALICGYLDDAVLPTAQEMQKIENGVWYQRAQRIIDARSSTAA